MNNPRGSSDSDKSTEQQQRLRNRPQNAGSGSDNGAGGSSSNAPREGIEIGGFSSATTSPPRPQIGGDAAAGAGGSSSGKRKRGRAVDRGASSSRGTKEKKKTEFDAPKYPKPCFCCGKQFPSWKALFGHMRTHKRKWKGCFPPPYFTPPEGMSPEREEQSHGSGGTEQELAETLLQLAKGVLARMTVGTSGGVEGAETGEESSSRGVDAAAGSSTREIDIDLDVVQEASASSPSSPAERGGVGFDLNMPSPEE